MTLYYIIKWYWDLGTADFKQLSLSKFMVSTLKMTVNVKELLRQYFNLSVNESGL